MVHTFCLLLMSQQGTTKAHIMAAQSIAIELSQKHQEQRQGAEQQAGRPGPLQEGLDPVQVAAVSLFDGLITGLALLLILGSGMLQSLDDAVLLLDGLEVMVALPPARKVLLLTHLGAFFDSFPGGIEQEIDVRGEVDISLDHKGITAAAQVDGIFF